jgi:hypothetical protein
MRPIIIKIVILFIGLSSVSCKPFIRPEQIHIDEKPIELDSTGQAGQTFSASYAGLMGIELYLDPQETTSGIIILSILENSSSNKIIEKASIDLNNGIIPGWHRFAFNPLSYSNNKDYYFSLTYDGSGVVKIGNGLGGQYLNGSAYKNNTPLNDRQVAFRLVYNEFDLVWGLLGGFGI